GNIEAVAEYYPYGLKWSGSGLMASTNRWLYNGKELQDAAGLDLLDYGFRMYDAFKGSWSSPDPLEQFVSPYTYAGNNPIRFIDPDGLWVEVPGGLSTNDEAEIRQFMNRLSEQEEEPDGNPTGYQGTPNIQKGDNIYRSTGPYWPGGGIDPRAFNGYNPDLENIEDIYEAIQTGNTILSIINDYGLDLKLKPSNLTKGVSKFTNALNLINTGKKIIEEDYKNIGVFDIISIIGTVVSLAPLMGPVTIYTDELPKQFDKGIKTLEVNSRNYFKALKKEYSRYILTY
ncbi:MAG: RHS repeat-associated core domain-containing protein, partial [Alistipes sp.]|nr:RHS repeat-associated core domain-containing protein [Alistipes sp.]